MTMKKTTKKKTLMNKMTKKLLPLVAGAALMMAAVTGCGSEAPASGGDSGQSVNLESAEQTEKDTQADTQTDGSSEDAAAGSTADSGSTEEQKDSGSNVDKTESAPVVRIGSLSGPTSMGLVKLMDDAEQGNTQNTYEFAELSTDPSAFVAPLSTGELDIAAVPSNLACVLYNKTEGGIQVLAINNLCVLNIVERGETVNTLADLKGKKVYATGQGAVPEYTLRYLLNQNGIDPDSDVEIQWCADTTEALSYVSADTEAIAMLPQPFATAALAQVEGLRLAIDLNEEWLNLQNGCKQVTGVIVVRKEFAEQNPDAVKIFLSEYEASMNYSLEDTEGAAALIEKSGIVGKAALAQKALPGCHLNYEIGKDMQTSLSGFLKILYDENPASVGGKLPEDDFYYGI